EHLAYYGIPADVTKYYLEVGKLRCPDLPGNGYEGYPGNARADHSAGNEIPWRLTVSRKKRLASRPAGRHHRNNDQHDEIDRDNREYQPWRHINPIKAHKKSRKRRNSKCRADRDRDVENH